MFLHSEAITNTVGSEQGGNVHDLWRNDRKLSDQDRWLLGLLVYRIVGYFRSLTDFADRSQSAKILIVKITLGSEQHTNENWAGPGYGLTARNLTAKIQERPIHENFNPRKCPAIRYVPEL